MPWLFNLIPDAGVLCALEPDELGLRMLPALASWPPAHHLTLAGFLLHAVGDGRAQVQPSQYPLQQRADVETAIREAWAWLEGTGLLIADKFRTPPAPDHTVRMLSRRARRLAEEPNVRRALSAQRIPKDSLHPTIREDVWALYHRGKYDTAVFEAMKAVEVAVREAAEFVAVDIGMKLMRKAFDVENGPLTDKTVEPSERQARSDLFAGAIGSYKNPHSHRNVALDDPDEAVEIIMLANQGSPHDSFKIVR